MTTPQQTRLALAEIPDRLEALRVAHTPTNTNRRTPDRPTPAATTTTVTHMEHTNMALPQDCIFTSLTSPDELVIRQRGRLQRRFTTTFSPDKSMTNARSPFQRTPTKNPQLTSGMILRSSPRKRLTMGSTPPEPRPFDISSPSKAFAAKQELWPGSPIVKKLRLGANDRPMAQLNTDVPLALLLQGMSQQQLIDLLVSGVSTTSTVDGKKAEEKLREKLSMPDISPLEQELMSAKRLIFKSLPTSRLCKKTDAAAYSRAALHLNEFRRLIQTHARRLHDSSHWDALLDYVTMAWNYVRATPNWDSVSHNTVRRQCFKILACYCITSLKNGGLRLGPTRLDMLERNLREWSKDYEDVLSCVNALQKTLTKSRTSL